MENMVTTHREDNIPEHHILKFAEHLSSPITIVDGLGIRHVLRKFVLLGNWGICNADCTQILVDPKETYAFVEIFVYTQRIVAGDLDNGWDIYSLTGEYQNSLPPMSLAKVLLILNAKKH